MRHQRSRGRSLVLALVAFAAVVLPNTAGADPAFTRRCSPRVGCWSAPFSEGVSGEAGAIGTFGGSHKPETIEEAGLYPTAVSAVVTPEGRVLYWDGLSGIERATPAELDFGRTADPDRSRLLDLGDDPSDLPLFMTPSPEAGGAPDNMFCADQRLMANGKIVVAGGTRYETMEPQLTPVTGPGGPAGHLELYGSKNTRLFTEDDNGGTWERTADMAQRRWYPTLVTQPDGDLFIAGGVSKLIFNSNALDPRAADVVPRNVRQSETFDPDTQTWTDNGTAAESTFPLFARMHLLPTGEIYFGTDGQQWNPAGQDVDELRWNMQKTYDPVTKSWRELGVSALGARSGALSVLLPLRPDAAGSYSEAKVMMAGGTLGTSPGTYLATPFTEIVTATDVDNDGHAEVTNELVSSLTRPRWYSSGVVLPNGEVLALNGGDRDDVIYPGSAGAVRTPELWDGNVWRPLPANARDRVYHNAALLLPDGSVLIGGHSPINRGNGNAAPENDEMGLNNNLRDPSFERYFPPYLFRGARPVITSAPSEASYGESLTFSVAGRRPGIGKVVLSRLPSPTHTTDADARTVELNFTVAPGSAPRTRDVTVESLPGSNILPPGYYYLFALNPQGAPSVAKIVKVG